MENKSETIDHATFVRLVEAGAVRGVVVVGQCGGWGVVIQYGMTERVLAARRGAVRVFRRLETLVVFLKALGIVKYPVDATLFNPEGLKTERKRLDAAERMRRAHAGVSKSNKTTT